jgi:hypothetical protein
MLRCTVTGSLTAVALFACAVMSAPVNAANLTSVQGDVTLSRAGGPFRPVGGPTVINTGDVVRAEPGSSAQIVYGSGAVAAVNSGASIRVAVDPSAVLAQPAFQGAPVWQTTTVVADATPTAAGVEPGATPTTDPAPAAPDNGNSVGTTVVVVGVIAAGAGALVLAKSAGDSKKSSSP